MSNRRNLLAWLTDEGNENLFVHYILVEKMYGKALRGTDRADLKEMGVKTGKTVFTTRRNKGPP